MRATATIISSRFPAYWRGRDGFKKFFMAALLVPIFGVVLGVLALQEQLRWNAYAGCALIMVGVMVVNNVFKPLTWPQRPSDAVAGS